MGLLLFDVGNTQIKWRFLDGDSVLRGVGSSLEGQRDWLSGLARRFSGVTGVAISCVKSAEYRAALVEDVRQLLGLDPYIAEVESRAFGLSCSYEDPSRMGVDRWLAMISAKEAFDGAFCVIDCGSAVTIDWVSVDGRHEGGFILAGLRLSIEALLGGTDQVVVDFDNLAAATTEPGVSTTEAVYHGALFGLLAQVEAAYAKLLVMAGDDDSNLILTGGDAKLLSEKLNVPHRLVDDLVFDGLRRAFYDSRV
ncbi:MAG: type III pantothenate kinase [Pseudomonadales bacterium]|nr:type III pantothenate kinase [Pseudomonadales bacterium]